MENQNQDREIRNLTQGAFKDFELNADSRVWDNIQKGLAEENKKKAAAWWPYAAAASVALLVGLFIYYPVDRTQLYNSTSQDPALFKNSNSDSYDFAIKEVENSPPKTNLSIKTQYFDQGKDAQNAGYSVRKVTPDNNMNTIANDEVKKNEKSGNNSELNDEFNQNISNMAVSEKEIDNKTEISNTEKLIAVNEIDTLSPEAAAAMLDMGAPLPPEEKEAKVKTNNGIYLAANFSSTGTTADDESELYAVPNANFDPTLFVDGMEKVDPYSYEFEERTFSTPIYASVTFNKSIGKRLGVESGLSYSLLRAKREAKSFNSDEPDITQREYLHYIGVPLHLNYRIAGKRNVLLYAHGILGIEKAVSYKISTTIDDSEESSSENQSVDGFKYFAGIGLGLEYKFIPIAGLYVLPGINYYNSTEDQPFDIDGNETSGILPNIRFGLRFHIN